MFRNFISACALLVAFTGVTSAQQPQTNQYLVPANAAANRWTPNQAMNNGQPGVTATLGDNWNTSPAGTINKADAMLTSSGKANAVGGNYNAVGGNYFDCHNGGGCHSGCGGCHSGCGGCHSGCGGCGDYGCHGGGCSGYDACGGYGSCGNGVGEEYFRVFAGENSLENYQTTAPFVGGPPQTLDAKFGDGWGTGIAFGRYVACNRRAELEFSYRRNTGETLSQWTRNGTVFTPLFGDIKTYSIMGNMLFERQILPGGSVYAGGGVGFTYARGEMTSVAGPARIDDTQFAYQGILGISAQASSRSKLFAEYRYLGTTGLGVEGPPNASDFEYRAQGVFVGVQFRK